MEKKEPKMKASKSFKKMKASKSFKKRKKVLTKEQKKSTWTFFTILFPSLLLTIILTFPRTIEFVITGILLFFYQAVILKKFTEDYYSITV